VIYREELERLGGAQDGLTVAYAFTRSKPPGWTGYARRVDREILREVAWPPSERPLIFVCGPTSFVEAVASKLVELGHDPSSVRTERFGGA
jgi:ferredoxin-NADP reductase